VSLVSYSLADIQRIQRTERVLTTKQISSLAAPGNGSKIYYDGRDDGGVAGFGVRITAAGARSYILNYRNESGTERRLTIGSADVWTLAKARARAKELRQAIDTGADPLAEVAALKASPTVNQLVERARREAFPSLRPRTARDYEGMIHIWIAPAIGSMRVAEVRSVHIAELHAKISRTAKYRANRVLSLLSRLFNLSIRWEMRTDNPCRHAVDRNPEEKRKVYLNPEQISRLGEALAADPDQDAADALRLCLLTGARSLSEVLRARWDQLDLQAGTWSKPASMTKQKETHSVPLSVPTLEILVKRRAKVRGDFVFPGRRMPHLTELRHIWSRMRAACDLAGVRVHDLRHSFASVLVSSGASLPMIGALLGHTQPGTTARYAHLMIDSL